MNAGTKRVPLFQATPFGRRLLLALLCLSLGIAFLLLGIVGFLLPGNAEHNGVLLPTSTEQLSRLGVFLWEQWYLPVLAVALLLIIECAWGRLIGHWLTYGYLVGLFGMLLFGYFMALVLYMPFHVLPVGPLR